MNYQTAFYIAITKRVLGWIIFSLALVSTVVSLVLLAEKQGLQGDGLNAVANDFIKIMALIIRQNTVFLNFFWHNSPIPSTHMGLSTANLGFILLFFLMFVGQALSASGNRMNRQLKFIKESIEDHLIFERAKGTEVSKEEIEAKITIPHHTIFQQFFILYILPIILGGILYFIMNILSW